MKMSVVIRNRNEGEFLDKTLQAIRAQTVPAQIIVVDNESSDESIKIAEQYGAEIVTINREEFSYGRALNRGIDASWGDIVVIVSAHAVLLSSRAFEAIIDALSDESVVGVRGEDVSYIAQHMFWAERKKLAGDVSWDEIWHSGLVNTCCAIRKDVWCKLPFDEDVGAAEDSLWSKRVLDAGWRISTCDLYYAYMRRPKFLQEIAGFMRVSEAQYTVARCTSHKIGIVEVMRRVAWINPKNCIRQCLLDVIRYCYLLWIPLQGPNTPPPGSLR
jgi:glycosyltransferase involved in cell wall biosynthesis